MLCVCVFLLIIAAFSPLATSGCLSTSYLLHNRDTLKVLSSKCTFLIWEHWVQSIYFKKIRCLKIIQIKSVLAFIFKKKSLLIPSVLYIFTWKFHSRHKWIHYYLLKAEGYWLIKTVYIYLSIRSGWQIPKSQTLPIYATWDPY